MKTFIATVGVIVAFLALIFGLNYFGLVNYQFFAPKYENARRETFENTQSYVEWKRQELVKYHYEFIRAKDTQDKEAIRMVVFQSFANFDLTKLSPELRKNFDEIVNYIPASTSSGLTNSGEIY